MRLPYAAPGESETLLAGNQSRFTVDGMEWNGMVESLPTNKSQGGTVVAAMLICDPTFLKNAVDDVAVVSAKMIQ